MDTTRANLQAIKARIAVAAQQAGRNPAEITLIAVSKGVVAESILNAHSAGQNVFGESYVQEAIAKIALCTKLLSSSLADLPPSQRSIQWHYIGPIQSNKTKVIAELFSWVHSIDRAKIAQRLSAARPATLPPLQVCIEVNVGGEATKSGVMHGQALELAQIVAGLPRLTLRGLMAIPPAGLDIDAQRSHFAKLRRLKEEIAAAGIALDTLSMGMSDDFEAAIAEGATCVRIGTAIFGART